MIGARSASMGFNRLVDAEIDRRNPRTSEREIPGGQISKFSALLFISAFSGLFIFSAFLLNPLCYYLSYPALLLLFFYSYTKRFTSYSHIILGAVIGISPVGGWFAVTGEFSLSPIILFFNLMLFISGFDIIYSCQDKDFDIKEGLYSIPVKYGLGKALKLAKLIHLGAVISFIVTGLIFSLNELYYLGIFLISVLLIIEHLIVKKDDLSKVNISFFYINAVVSVLFLISVWAGKL